MADEKLVFKYHFDSDGQVENFTCHIDRQTLINEEVAQENPPDWTRLEVGKCENCPLQVEHHSHCPAALSLVRIATQFGNRLSYEKTVTAVETEIRTVSLKGDLQKGLSPLVGLLLATSGCPRFSLFQPMALFHLPFATPEETHFRVFANTLAKAYFSGKEFDIGTIADNYSAISIVNRGLSTRLSKAIEGDSGLNSIVILDLFSMSYIIDEGVIERTFKHYFH